MSKTYIIPKTINDAVKVLIPMFKGMDEYFTKDEDYFASFCHSQLSGGIGMKIRNMFGFWTHKKTSLYNELKNKGCEHEDEMSDYLIRLIYKHYN